MKTLFTACLLSLSAAFLSPAAIAQTAEKYPNRPVKLLVGFVPGGVPDLIARVLGRKLTDILGQPFVIDNRPGGAATLAAGVLAGSKPDGYTLMLSEPGPLAIAPFTMKKLSYDPLKDLAPIAMVGTTPGVLISNAKTTQIKTLQDLIREAKANPGKLSYGSSGVGSIHHIATEVFLADAGIDVLHVPYKGSGQSVPALLAGDIPLLMTSVAVAQQYAKTGAVNILAVSSGRRFPDSPDIMSISEVVKDYDYASELGILAPAGIPPAVVDRLTNAIREALDSKEVKDQFRSASIAPVYQAPAAYRDSMVRNLKKYERAVKLAKIQPE